MRHLLYAVLAWLLGSIDRGDRDCPYRCERHREAWVRRIPPSGW